MPFNLCTVETGIWNKPFRIMSCVWAVGDSIWCSPLRYVVSLSNCRACPAADVQHGLRGSLRCWIRNQMTTTELFQSDLAFCQLLVNQAQFVVLQQYLEAEL